MISDVDEHILRIRKNRFFMYERARSHLLDLQDVLATPKRARMPNRLIVGPSNNGKTMLLEYFMRKHPRSENRDGDVSRIPIVLVQVDGPDERQLYDAILEYLRTPTSTTMTLSAKSLQVMRQMFTVGASMLIIDEFHNLLGGSASRQDHFRNVIKKLSNVLQIPIVGAGTYRAYNALQADEQLSNRFFPLELPKWKNDDELGRLLKGVKGAWGIEFEEEPLADEVLARTDRTIGGITELLERAAVYALRTLNAAHITRKTLDACGYISPDSRARALS